MSSRVSWVGVVAVLTTLTAVSPCLAQDGYLPGRGAIGGQIGGGWILADADYSEGAAPRFGFAATFRYVMSPSLRWQVSPGYFWNAYKDGVAAPFADLNFPTDTVKNEYLTQVIPISLQLQYTQKRGQWVYHVGAGGGFYRIWVENRRKVLKDPATFELHRKLHPGLTGELGAECFLKSMTNMSVQLVADSHLIFAESDDYPSGFNSNLLSLGVRVGANYYFDLPGTKKAPAEPPAEPPASPSSP